MQFYLSMVLPVLLFICVTPAFAVPLCSKSVSKTLDRSRCNNADALQVGFETERDSGDLVTVTRSKAKSCDTSIFQPAIRLTAFPNTGTTWIQYLLEEATKIATQNPQSSIVQPGRPFLFPHDKVTCRAHCGAQLYTHPNCTVGSPESSGVEVANSTQPEIFKNHYPDFTDPYAMFETDNVIQKTLLLVRNPLDSFLAQLRHIPSDESDKVGEMDLEECPEGFTAMRPETNNTAIDPLNICNHDGVVGDTFELSILQWRDFLNFWFGNSATACTDLVAVRYEDLVKSPGHVLDILLEKSGLSGWSPDATTLAIEAFPPDSDRLGYNIYFNESLAQNHTIQAWAHKAMQVAGNFVQQFGYGPFMTRILESGGDP